MMYPTPCVSSSLTIISQNLLHLTSYNPNPCLSAAVPSAELVANLTCVNSNMSAFDKRHLPRRHHYANNERIDDVVLVLNDRWQADAYSASCDIIGNHGWDPKYESVRVGGVRVLIQS